MTDFASSPLPSSPSAPSHAASHSRRELVQSDFHTPISLEGTFISDSAIVAVLPIDAGTVCTVELGCTVRLRQSAGHIMCQQKLRHTAEPTAAVLTSECCLFIGRSNGLITVLSTEGLRCIADCSGVHTQGITHLSFFEPWSVVISCSGDGSVGFWDATRLCCRKLVRIREVGCGGVNCLAFDQALSLICAPAQKSEAFSQRAVQFFCNGDNGGIVSLNVSPNFECENRTLSILNMEAKVEVLSLLHHSNVLWIGCENGMIKVIDLLTKSCVKVLSDPERGAKGSFVHRGPVHCLFANHGDTKVWSLSMDGTVGLWTTATFEFCGELPLSFFRRRALQKKEEVPQQQHFMFCIAPVAASSVWRIWTCGTDGSVRSWLSQAPNAPSVEQFTALELLQQAQRDRISELQQRVPFTEQELQAFLGEKRAEWTRELVSATSRCEALEQRLSTSEESQQAQRAANCNIQKRLSLEIQEARLEMEETARRMAFSSEEATKRFGILKEVNDWTAHLLNNFNVSTAHFELRYSEEIAKMTDRLVESEIQLSEWKERSRWEKDALLEERANLQQALSSAVLSRADALEKLRVSEAQFCSANAALQERVQYFDTMLTKIGSESQAIDAEAAVHNESLREEIKRMNTELKVSEELRHQLEEKVNLSVLQLREAVHLSDDSLNASVSALQRAAIAQSEVEVLRSEVQRLKLAQLQQPIVKEIGLCAECERRESEHRAEMTFLKDLHASSLRDKDRELRLHRIMSAEKKVDRAEDIDTKNQPLQQSRIESLEAKIISITEELNSVKAKEEAADEKCRLLMNDARTVQQKVFDLESVVSRTESINKNLSTELEDTKSLLEKHTVELRKRQSKIGDLQQEILLLQQSAKSKERELSLKAEDSEKDTKRVVDMKLKLEGELTDRDQREAALSTEVRRLRSQLEEYIEKDRRNTELLKAEKGVTLRLEEDIEKIKLELHKVRNENEGLSIELGFAQRVKGQLQLVEADRDQKQSENQKLHQAVEEREEIQRSAEKTSRQMGILERALQEQEGVCDDLRKANRVLLAERDKIVETVKDRDKEILDFKAQLKELQLQCAKLNQHNEELATNLGAAEKHCHAQEDVIVQLQEKCASFAPLQSRAAELRGELDVALHELHDAEFVQNRQEEAMAEAMRRIQKLLRDNEVYRMKLETAGRESQELTHQLVNTKHVNEQLKSDLHQMGIRLASVSARCYHLELREHTGLPKATQPPPPVLARPEEISSHPFDEVRRSSPVPTLSI